MRLNLILLFVWLLPSSIRSGTWVSPLAAQSGATSVQASEHHAVEHDHGQAQAAAVKPANSSPRPHTRVGRPAAHA
jgi:hypothetical protein